MEAVDTRRAVDRLDPKDVCQYGHQLAPGSSSISIPQYDSDGVRLLKPETRLLRNHAAPGWDSVLAAHGMAPAECAHGLAALPADFPPMSRAPLRNEAGEQLPPVGRTWIRAKYLRPDGMGGMINCPVCRGEPAPADMVTFGVA